MARDFQQQDNSGTCGTIVSCSGGTVADGPVNRAAVFGGTAGTTEATFNLKNPATTRAAVFFEITPQNGLEWQTGTAIIRLNVTTANANLTWRHTRICRLSSACADIVTYGSLLAHNTPLDTTGVKTVNVPCTATTPNDGDKIYIILIFDSAGTHGNDSAGFIPNQLLNLPLAVPARRGRVSAYEFEVPNAPRRARVSAYEFEVPNAPRRAWVSAYEFEVPDTPAGEGVDPYTDPSYLLIPHAVRRIPGTLVRRTTEGTIPGLLSPDIRIPSTIAWPGSVFHYFRPAQPVGQSVAANDLFALPGFLRAGQRILRLGAYIVSGAAGNFRVGLYSSRITDLYPDELIVDSGSLSTAISGQVSLSIGITIQTTGLYWAAFITDTGTPTFSVITTTVPGFVLGMDSTSGANIAGILSAAFGFGSLPTEFPAGATFAPGSVPVPILQFANVVP